MSKKLVCVLLIFALITFIEGVEARDLSNSDLIKRTLDKSDNSGVSVAGAEKIFRVNGKLGNIQTLSANEIDGKVRHFLATNRKQFDINPDNLLLVSSSIPDNKEALSLLKYEQIFSGIKVYSSTVIVAIKRDTIVTVKSNYFSGIQIDTTPGLNTDRITEIIQQDLGIAIDNEKLKLYKPFKLDDLINKPLNSGTTIKEISKVIYPIKTGDNIEYKLAYKVELGLILIPPAKWVYLVDANNGEILEKNNKVVFENINGRVSGQIYPESPVQTKSARGFGNEKLTKSLNATGNVFWSGKGNNLDNTLITKEPISLASASSAVLSFKTKYSIQKYNDTGLVLVSPNKREWYIADVLTGNLRTWETREINFSSIIGYDIYLAFEYLTDSSITDEGWYIDDIKVETDQGPVFSDNANDLSLWTNDGFSIVQRDIANYSTIGYTDPIGNYSLSGLSGSINLYTELEGKFVKVYDIDGDSNHSTTLTAPATHNWDWNDYDTSYKKEESNVYYHVNNVHDFFTKGDPFNIDSMNIPITAMVQYPGTCNAFSEGTDIFFFEAGDGCEATSLYSDIIYHEYTHSVVNHIYTTDLPYWSESGALDEGWADYFATTINNNSCLGEGFMGETCLRDTNNAIKYPYDMLGEVHYDSRIVSGAAWDLRKLMGSKNADALIINAIKLEPFNFTEYLEDLMIADDDNANLEDGTPHLYEICTAFYSKHGIPSSYCGKYYTIPETVNLLKNPGFEDGPMDWEQSSSGGYKLIESSNRARNGNWQAILGGYPEAKDAISQDVSIPSDAKQVYVQFWYAALTLKTSDKPLDSMKVEILKPSDNTVLKSLVTLSNLDMLYGGYNISKQFDVSEFKGQTVRLRFQMSTNAENNTTMFLIDDAALMINNEPQLAQIASINVSPSTSSMNVGDTKQFIATAMDNNGSALAGINISWTSSNKSVGTIAPSTSITGPDGTASATFTALANGSATIEAANGSASGSADIIVNGNIISELTVNVSNGKISTVGSNTTLDIMLNKAPEGLSGYNISLTLSNATVAEIISVSFPAWAAPNSSSSLPRDSIWLKASDLNNKIQKGAENIILATLTVRGDNMGKTEINPAIISMDDDNGSIIEADTVSGQLEIGSGDSVIPFPCGTCKTPTDPDNDGLYEDINGNGRKDFQDIVLLFNYLEWVSSNEPIPNFDFNKNGRIDFNDIIKLFEEL